MRGMMMKKLRIVFFLCFLHGILYAQDSKTLLKKEAKAYNNHDIDSFMACYADSACLYIFPNQLIAQGKEVIKERYKKRFETSPQVRSKMLKTYLHGNKRIKIERIFGVENKKPFNVMGIYEFNSAGLIIKKYLVYE